MAVEDVAGLIGRSYRHVEIEFSAPVDVAEFRGLPGVSELEAEDNRIAFRFEGDLDPVVKAAARHPVRDLEVTRPSLEEVYLELTAEPEQVAL